MAESTPGEYLRTRLIQGFIWHEGEVGTVIVAPEGVGKSTLIGQIRRTAGDAAYFVEATMPGVLPGRESKLPLFVYLDPADTWSDQQLAGALMGAQHGLFYLVATFRDAPPRDFQAAIAAGSLRLIGAEAFRFDPDERDDEPRLAIRIDARLGASRGSI